MKKQADQFQPLNEPIPEGLEYRQEYWEGALAMIQRRERTALVWRFSTAALLLLVASGALGWYYSTSAESTNAQVAKAYQADTAINQSAAVAYDHSTAVGSYGSTKPRQSVASHDEVRPQTNGSQPELTSAPAAKRDVLNPKLDDSPVPDGEASSSQTAATDEGASATRLDRDTPEAKAAPDLTENNSATGSNTASISSIPLNNSASRAEDMTTTPVISQAKGPGSGSSDEADNTKGELPSSDVASPDVLPDWEFMLPLNRVGDLVEPQLQQSEDWRQLEPINRMKRFTADLFLGSNVLTGFGTPVRRQAFDPSFGFEGRYNRNARWSASVGMEYFSISGLNRTQYTWQTAKDVQLDGGVYGSVTDTIRIHTDRLHYLSLPIGVGVNLGQRHRVEGYAGLSYLMQAAQTREVVSVPNGGGSDAFYSPSGDSENGDIEVSQDKGYLDGFSSVNAFVALGYTYTVNNRLAIGLRSTYGFTDITRGDRVLFYQEGDDRNSRVTAVVRMNVW